MDRIRIGIVGLGGICRTRHIPGLQAIEGVELAAVANRTLESARAAAGEFGIPETHAHWKDVVDRDDLDAILIGTWPYMHHPVSLAALQSGKHVFCQARMAMNAAEAAEMHAAWRNSGKVAMLCPVPIGLNVDQTIARFLREDRLGPVRYVQVRGMSGAFTDAGAPMTWRKDHRLSGLNMLTLGMYFEVIHRWFGWTRAITADTQIYTPARPDGAGAVTEVRIPDQALVNARMDGGVMVQYVISGMTPHASDSIEIFGEKATLHYDVASGKLFEQSGAGGGILDTGAGEGRREEVAIAPEDAYDVNNWRVERDFIDAIREGSPYTPSFEDGLWYMRAVQAVYDSAPSGHRVELSE